MTGVHHVPGSAPGGGLPRSGWPPGLAALAALAILGGSALVATAGTAILTETPRPPMPPSASGVPLRDPQMAMAWLLIFQSAVIVQALAAARLFGGSLPRALALSAPPGGWRMLGPAIAALAAFSAAYAGLVHLVDPAALWRDLAVAAALLRSDAWPLALVAIGIGAPLSEELLFRGFLLPALARSRLGLPGAALVVTGGWTALHAGYSAYGLVEVFLIGLYLAWLLARSGSLWVPILCHAIYNTALALALMWLPLAL